MSDRYRELLDATLQHVQDLKSSGVKFLPVDRETLASLSVPPRRQTAKAPPPGPPALVLAQPSSPGVRQSAIAPAELALSVSSGESATAAGTLLSREAKEQAMADLRARAMVCQKCPHLARSRKNVVFGVGDIHSPLMFVGEAPGADEDEQGEPFVGKAGQLLTRIIQTMGFARQTVYIANILKCRPDTPGQTAGNRKPTPEEMKTCLPYLLAQIDLIQPKVIVALGATAVEGLFGKTTGITKLRGNWKSFRNTPVMPTYHPAYLLRNQALSEKRKVWEDMLQVMERLAVPISDKQRGFFLKS